MTKSPAAPQPINLRRNDMPKLLAPSRLNLEEHATTRLRAVVPNDASWEDVQKPGYWVNVIGRFKGNDSTSDPDRTGSIIFVESEDGMMVAEFYVRAVLPNGLLLTCLGPGVDLKTGERTAYNTITKRAWTGRVQIEGGELQARWNVGRKGYDIVRKSDGEVLGSAEQIRTAEQAQEWIAKATKAA